MDSIEKQYFGPLSLHQSNDAPTIFKINEDPVDVVCLLCDKMYTFPVFEKPFLTHLFMEHRLVIADANQIADLAAYAKYWRSRLESHPLPYYCTTMLLDNKPDGTKSKDEEYYLLSDVLPEDKELRTNLQLIKLEKLLKLHAFEREDKQYIRECLFCRYVSNTTRAGYLSHLFEKHNFFIAKPDNLIFIDKLIDLIAFKVERLQCIFCDGYFKDRNILKEHMRKKGHKRINPENKEYDKFYLINYAGEKYPAHVKHRIRGKKLNKCRQITEPNCEYEPEPNVDSDPEWSTWTEENGPLITCLFCDHSEMKYESILDHMEKEHEFSFTKETIGFDFYHKINVVNYIRHQIHLKQCLACDAKFDDMKDLEKHLKDNKHLVLSKEKWDQPEYYFPTYEDDLFLSFIHDDDDAWWSCDEQETEKRNSMSDSISKEMAMAVLED